MAAFEVLRAVNGEDAYANLVLPRYLDRYRLTGRDAGFTTELVAGTCRRQGSYDVILSAASGRELASLQPAVVDLLRLGCHQLLGMRVPAHAAVAAGVDLAAATVGPRVTGLVNAVLRRVAARDWEGWLDQLSAGLSPIEALALRTAHPVWVVQAFADRLDVAATDLAGPTSPAEPVEPVERMEPAVELEAALAADNLAPEVTLAVRPGLAAVSELLAAGAHPGRWSPYAAGWRGRPDDLAAVRDGRAGVQDEGSQLAALALARAEAPDGPWLDCCAGPGGKAALLAGLALERSEVLLAAEVAPHRAVLVARALSGYRHGGRGDAERGGPGIVVADGTRPAWPDRTFARVLVDAPCTGLGALRRRPEARWRRRPESLEQLVPLQRRLLHGAVDALLPGGVVGYVTCSPHRRETVEVVQAVLSERDDLEPLDTAALLPELVERQAADGDAVQLWPHRQGTDAMFIALLRRRALG